MGSRKQRIGLIIPSSNSTVEPDFHYVLPANASLHSARVFLVETTIESLERMNLEAESAAKSLASADVDVITYACTSGSFLGGPGYDQSLLARLSEVSSGTGAIGTTPAVIAALNIQGIKRLSVVTPYLDSINQRLTDFLVHSGFDVTSMAGQQLVSNLDIGDQTPDQILEFCKENLDQSADGFFLSCTNWRAIEVAETLERELGKPVVTSNQATIWATLRFLGYEQPIKGFGSLLSNNQPERIVN